VAKHRGVPKSTSNIREAVSRRKRMHSRNFFNNYVVAKRKLHTGWNLRKKHYIFGGLALIYVSIESSSPFPIDESPLRDNKFRMTWTRSSDGEPFRNPNAWHESLHTKSIRKTLGKLTYEEAKKLFEKEMGIENRKFYNMTDRYFDKNRGGKVEKLRWFKLIVR
jgi:hypothetical protein